MTKDEILSAAAQIFREKGFHAASMQDIADAVQVRKASLYYHVASKQDILNELLDQAMDRLNLGMTEILDSADPPAEKLARAITAYALVLSNYPDLSSALLLEYRSLDPEFRSHHKPRREHFESIWLQLLSEGQASGVFKLNDPAITLRLILGSLNWSLTWFNPSGRLSPESFGEQVGQLFLNGLIRA
jgi:AcrR family transcriptional regulator